MNSIELVGHEWIETREGPRRSPLVSHWKKHVNHCVCLPWKKLEYGYCSCIQLIYARRNQYERSVNIFLQLSLFLISLRIVAFRRPLCNVILTLDCQRFRESSHISLSVSRQVYNYTTSFHELRWMDACNGLPWIFLQPSTIINYSFALIV